MAVLSLLSDFGISDSYVAQMKGRILSICPSAAIVDISHSISPQNVRQAAWVLRDAVAAFPPDTVHVAVVDPGVGSSRRRILIEALVPGLYGEEEKRAFFIGPDNGLLSLAASKEKRMSVREISEIESLSPSAVLSTFDGRDVFAPTGAMLLAGAGISQLGAELQAEMIELSDPQPNFGEDGVLHGEIAYFDHFGNAISNISAALLPEDFHVQLNEPGPESLPRVSSYAEIEGGSCAALINSGGRLELAARDGSAERLFNLELGRNLSVVPREN